MDGRDRRLAASAHTVLYAIGVCARNRRRWR
jgi:hypothetical protein